MSPIHKSDWLLAGECAETEGTHVRLEAAEQVTEERVLDAEGQRLPLDHRALDVVVVDTEAKTVTSPQCARMASRAPERTP